MKVQMLQTGQTIQGLSSELRVRGDLDMSHLDMVFERRCDVDCGHEVPAQGWCKSDAGNGLACTCKFQEMLLNARVTTSTTQRARPCRDR